MIKYTIWIDLGDGLWHHEEAEALLAAIEIAAAMQAVDITQGDLCWSQVEGSWSSYTMEIINVG